MWPSRWARRSTGRWAQGRHRLYGFALPMDDCRALVLLDFGGRIDFEWEAEFRREWIGDVPTELFRHFFHALCSAARCNLPDRGPRRKRAPQGRGDLQGLRTRSCAWPWPGKVSDTTYPAAKASYDSGSGLRYGQPALGGRCPAQDRGRVHADGRPGAAAAGRAGDSARGRRGGERHGPAPRAGTRRGDTPVEGSRAGNLHRHAAALPMERGGRHGLSRHLSTRVGRIPATMRGRESG